MLSEHPTANADAARRDDWQDEIIKLAQAALRSDSRRDAARRAGVRVLRPVNPGE